jgi:uncharacterized repeat protein (TIGR01451 family)
MKKNLGARLAALAVAVLVPGLASAALTITPLTWNVVGLDSNNPAVGPKDFPVGARVCSSIPTTDVHVTWFWDSVNANINLRPGSLSALTIPSIALGACVDAYFEVEVTQVAAAFDTSRRYHVTATDGTGTVSTPTPREMYVEHLISQSRNSITGIKVDGTPVALGGSVALVVGNTYTIELDSGTATQGYNQFESFINLTNAIFQIQAVATTYSANNSPYVVGPAPLVSDKLYADACLWDSNPASVNYRSCIGGDFKSGGSTITNTYTIKILSGGGTMQTLSTLLYDFSGSSYHYNADFLTGSITANIIDPASLTLAKAFSPSPTVAGGTSTLTFTIGNPSAAAVPGANFTDNLPLLAGSQMVVATPATYSTSGCGSPTFAPVAGAASISLANATIPASGNCTVNVRVSVPSLPTSGTYVNVSNNLFAGAIDTGHSAAATLGLTTVAPPVTTCGLTLAQWNFNGFTTNPPPQPSPSTQAGDVGTAAISVGNGLTDIPDAAASGGNPAPGLLTFGWFKLGPIVTAVDPFVQFAIDTSKYTQVQFAFDASRKANGPTNDALYYSTDGVTWNLKSTFNSTTSWATYGAYDFTGETNASGTTYFRIYGFGANATSQGADLTFDNATFTGCGVPAQPTLTKIFSPTPVTVGGTSTLTFTLNNPGTLSLTGAKFTDNLPAGTQVAGAPSATTTCAGSPTWAPLPGATTLAFGQTTGATIAAGSSCTASVNVTATTAGTHTNVSGFISSTQSGTNSGTGGSAVATLGAVLPPTIAKAFTPNPIPAGGVSVLTFTVTNPNAADALTGVTFADNYPAGLTNANPLLPAVTNTCGGSVTAVAGATSVSLAGGSIAAATSCTVSVPVTSSTPNIYFNTSGAVSAAIAGSGNTASASLTVDPVSPAIDMLKKIGISPAGPWFSFVAVAPGTPLYYQFTVENVGDRALNPFGVNDPALAAAGVDPASCVWQTPNIPSTLPVLPVGTATIDPTAICVVGPTAAVLGSHSNTATAQGTYSGIAYPSSPSTASYLAALPGFTLLKEIATAPGGPWTGAVTVAAGSGVYYRFTIVNTGGLLLSSIGVTDPMVSTAACSFIDPLPVLGATTCTVGPVTTSGAPNSTTTNTATAHGTNGAVVLTTPPASASYTINPPSADLAITKDNGASALTAGAGTTYAIVVTNNGPDEVASATVSDTAPAGLTIGSWTCAVTNVGSGGSVTTACGSLSGSGNINTTATMQSGAVITYTVPATVSAGASGTVANTATVTGAVTDPVPANNTATDTDPIGFAADLAITKDNGVSSVTAGSGVTYTVVATNNGPSNVVGATVSDTLPATIVGATWICTASPGSSCPSPGSGNINVNVDLLAGGTATFVLSGTVASTATGTLSNTATVTPPAGVPDPAPANNSATDSDPINLAAALVVTKTNGATNVFAGATTTYTIVVANNGPSDVAGAILADPLPAGVTGATWTCAGSGGGTCPPSGAGSINVSVDLPMAASVTFTVVAAISSSAIGTVANTATITPPVGVTDPAPANNTATDSDPVIAQADLAITKTDGVTSVTPGGTTTYTIVVNNAGPADAVGAAVVDSLPATIATATWTCTAGAGASCTASGSGSINDTVSIPAGSSVTYTVIANISAAAIGSLTNTASVAGVTDPNPGNNSATDTDTIIPLAVNADLAITKTDGVASVTAGGTTTYTIVASNAGPSPVTGALVSDTLPAAITGATWTCVGAAGGACPASGSGSISASVNLPVGASVTFALLATISSGASGTLTNTATVSTPAGIIDPTPGNNGATDSDTIVPATVMADLAIVKTNGAASLTVGATTIYTLAVSNNGPGEVVDAVVTDVAPAGLVFGTWSCAVANPGSGGTVTTACGAASGAGNIGTTATMKVGAVIVYTLHATVAPGAAGSITNVATVNPPAGVTDPTPANGSSSNTLPVIAAPTAGHPIPTLSQWCLAILSLLLAAMAMRRLLDTARKRLQ